MFVIGPNDVIPRQTLAVQADIRGLGKEGDIIYGKRHQPRRALIEFDGNRIHGMEIGVGKFW